MSYLVLARKYRPRSFADMVGQEHVVRALSNALDADRLHHAYLFTGTRGVGKTTVSRILAKSLNCQGPDGQGGITSQPCGVCQACSDIDAGRFIDYTELDAASNRSVDDVESLLEQAVYKPVQGRFKVFMIDEVHMLTGHAFNAMLKTLEEPPAYLKFVLATTDPQKVPVTVLSRCLQFNLRPMAPQTVSEHLARVLAAEGVPAEAPALALLGRAARGSMRDALSLTDQAIAFGAGRVDESTVRQMLGSVDRSHVLRLIEALGAGDGAGVVAIVDELRDHGLNAASVLEEMASVLQRLAVLQAVPDAVEPGDPDGPALQALAAQWPADETQLLYSICLHGRAELGLAPDEYAGLCMVLLRLLAFQAPATEKKSLNDAAAARAAAANASPMPVTATPTRAAPPAALRAAPAIVAPAIPPVAAPAPAVVPAARVPSPPAERPVPAGASSPQPAAMPEPPAGNAGAAPSRPIPPGTVVPVLDDPGAARAPRPPAAVGPAVVAMPVRQQSDARVDASARTREAVPTLVRTEEGDFWHELVMGLISREAIAALVRELALQAQLVARDSDQWLLRVEREALNQAGARERLAGALAVAGHPVRLVVEVGRVSDSPARRNAAAAAERQMGAERAIFEDPMVQAIMREFGAKIVPGSIKPL